MGRFYQQLFELAEAGEPVVTATVIAAKGSTPRDVGAKMIVRRGGGMVGSVGGGCGEAQVLWDAVRAFDEGTALVSEIDLTGEMNDQSSTHCGGIMEVFIDPLRWESTPPLGVSAPNAMRLIRAACENRQPVTLIAVVSNPDGEGGLSVGAKWVVRPDGALVGRFPDAGDLAPVLIEIASEAVADGKSRRIWMRQVGGRWARTAQEGGVGLFIDAIVPAPELIVVGAGHIAAPLVTMAKLLDFEVTVIDDRAAFANRGRFPEADAIVVGRIDEQLRRRSITQNTYLVLVTRGHQFDEAALRVTIGSPAPYIGMIGSRRRVREVFRHLREAGVPREQIERVHAPIGLDIGAETPAEIATAIVAELVQVRRAGVARSLGRAREAG